MYALSGGDLRLGRDNRGFRLFAHGVFVETFADFGIEVSIDEARAPMGLPKRAHIEAMLAAPRIAAAWQDTRGGAPTQADVDALYALFVPKNETVAARYAALVPGTVETMAALRARGLKIGSTTGYTRSIMAYVLPVAAAQGFSLDNWSARRSARGRPGPGACCAAAPTLAWTGHWH